MKFYFIRHGQTEYNLEKRIQGYSVDSPLTSKGIADAKKVGNVLRDVAFDAVYVSSQERAVDTCRYILKENKHVRFRVFLRGREVSEPQVGFEVLNKVASMLEDVANIDRDYKVEGRYVNMLVTPKK